MLGLEVAAVTRLSIEDFHVVEKLQKVGIDVFPFFTESSTHMKLIYPSQNPDERILKCEITAGSFTPDQFDGLEAKAFLMNGSIRGEIPFDVIESLKKKNALLVVDIQGFIRTVSPDYTLINANWPEKKEYLALIDFVKADVVEAKALTGESDKMKAALMIAEWGPKEVVITHNSGILVLADGKFYESEFKAGTLEGRSGRGDTCIASYMAKRLTEQPEVAILWSAAVTSMKMESEGPFLRSVEEVENFMNLKY
ncbi:MAG: hypothetical protein MUO34_14620, partial [Ignavibacteriaceae bacterium]|nr:hypothetical protein [Ignavibacteriaceae bacterium]